MRVQIPSRQRTCLAAAIDALLPRSDIRPAPAVLRAATACGALLGYCICAGAADYIVDTAGDPGPVGTTSLRQAIGQANLSADKLIQFDSSLSGSTITLKQGALYISASMSIEGPGADKMSISGNDVVGVLYAGTQAASPLSVTLSGLTLTHGNRLNGGAIYTKNVSLTLHDSVITGNNALSGGGIYAFSDGSHASQATLTNVSIENNGANNGAGIYASGGAGFALSHVTIATNTANFARGGGFFFNAGSITIADSLLINNNSSDGNGGGLAVSGSSLSLSNSTISGNSATNGSGGGLWLTGTSLHTSLSTISGNSASTGDGGGLWTDGGYTAIVGTRVSGNSAQNGGGIFVDNSGGLLTISQSTISGNSAGATSAFGGGIDVERLAFFTVTASLISGNNAYDFSGGGGGGIALRHVYSSASIRNSTVYGNYAYNNGGGIGIFDATGGNNTFVGSSTIAGNVTFNYLSNGILGGAGTPTLDNCILASGNSHVGNQDLDGSFSVSYSLIRTQGSANLSGSGNIIGQDPQLGPLTVNGGPTLTMLPAAATSPVLDAGDPAIVTGNDQRGLSRVVNGRADMGAVERQYPEDVIFRNGFDSS